jgi:hypothetical protein
MCGAFAIRLPVGVEQRAREVEALLDVDRVGGVLQLQTHLLGDVHEEVVEDLEHHRIDAGADRERDSRAATRSISRWSCAVTRACQPGSTTVVALRSAMIAGPSITWPGRAFSRTTRPASHQRPPLQSCTVAAIGAACAGCSAKTGSPGASPCPTASTETGLDDQAALRHQEREALAVRDLERGADLVGAAERHDQRRIGAFVAHVRAPMHAQPLAADPLAQQLALGVAARAHRRWRRPASSAVASGSSTAASRITLWSARPMP